MMLKYSILTINYRTADQVIKLWESLHKHLNPDEFEFILVDNNSGIEETKKLNNFFDQKSQAHFVPLQKNIGFGAGYAEAIRFAQGEFLALINPDVEIHAHTLEQLVEALEIYPKSGIVAPQLQNPDGTLQTNARNFPRLTDLILRRLGFTEKPLSNGPVPWVQGSFMCLRRRFFTDVLQGFDPRFFLFFEDTDLCRRCWLAGFEVRLITEATATHGQHRLSGHDILTAMLRRTFWIHVLSAFKYFWKYRFQKPPTIL